MSFPASSPPPSARPWEMPDSYLLLFLIVLLAAILSWVVPAGSFTMKEIIVERADGPVTRQVLDPASFRIAQTADGRPLYLGISLFAGETGRGEKIHLLPGTAEGRTGFLNYAFEGLVSGNKYGSAVGVVAFILLIGGAFGMILRTGAVEAGILWLIQRYQHSHVVLLPVLFLTFSLGGAVLGMGEEAIAFAILLAPLLLAMGYDGITVALLTYGATQVGFATSWMNPFNVSIAQGLAGVPLLSGVGYRFVLWLVFTAVSLGWVLWYAHRVKRHPEKSLTHQSDQAWRLEMDQQRPPDARFRPGHGFVLLILLGGVAWITHGVIRHQFFIPEIATQFFATGVAAGIAGVLFRLQEMRWNDLAVSFRKGASDLLGAAMIVGMAKGIVIMLGGDSPTEPSVLNTILHAAGQVIESWSGYASAGGMLAFQSGLNFFVPSGSGQAALTMPIMAPLADLAGVERQLAVLAFQLGDGLTNLIIPTSASLMGTLAVARVDFLTWLRSMYPLQIILILLSYFFVFLALAIGWH